MIRLNKVDSTQKLIVTIPNISYVLNIISGGDLSCGVLNY